MKIAKYLSISWVVASQLLVYPALANADTGNPKTNVNELDKVVQSDKPAKDEKGAPLPLHTIEGTGGILITPTAYLVNPGPKDQIFGLPSVSGTYINADQKNIEVFALTETLVQRVELGFSASRFGTGSLRNSVLDAGGPDIRRDDVYLYNFNVRGLIIPENSFNVPVPAITAGISYKYNDGIAQINNRLGGALTNIGYKSNDGVDFTLTASKTFPKVFDRALLLSAGVRFSEASQLGYVGFGDTYQATFEGNIAYSLTDWLWLAGEYRQKDNPYTRIGNLVRPEEDWYTVGLAFVPNNHITITVGYGYFGNVLDTSEKTGVAAQVKYEF